MNNCFWEMKGLRFKIGSKPYKSEEVYLEYTEDQGYANQVEKLNFIEYKNGYRIALTVQYHSGSTARFAEKLMYKDLIKDCIKQGTNKVYQLK